VGIEPAVAIRSGRIERASGERAAEPGTPQRGCWQAVWTLVQPRPPANLLLRP